MNIDLSEPTLFFFLLRYFKAYSRFHAVSAKDEFTAHLSCAFQNYELTTFLKLLT